MPPRRHRVRRALLVAPVLVALLAVGDLTWQALKRDAAHAPSAADQQPLGTPLSWAPPPLEHPITIRVGRSGGKFELEPERDYQIVLTETVSAPGGVILDGGRDVVLIDGHITIPWAGPGAGGDQRRALLLQHQTGTVHIEGLLIDNSGGDLSEGIQIDAKSAIVHIENVRISGVHARDEVNFSDNHPDLIQPWGGVRELLVDHLTGSTGYQGLFLVANFGKIGHVVLRNVNLTATASGKYLLWKGPDRAQTFPMEIEGLWLDTSAAGGPVGIWPDGRSATPCRAVVAADRNSVSWAPGCGTEGSAQIGLPPGGDFVPAARIGLGYVSPGYQ